MDVITVYEETQKAIKMVKEENTPVLEIQTYCYRGHSMVIRPGTGLRKNWKNINRILTILRKKMADAGLDR